MRVSLFLFRSTRHISYDQTTTEADCARMMLFLMSVSLVADPFDAGRATVSDLSAANSRCDLAQYCPPQPSQFNDANPFLTSLQARGGVPVPRTQPPMFHAQQSQAQPTQQPYAAMQQQISRHQRVLLFLRHCAKCTDPTRCVYSAKCQSGKQLWTHIFQCSNQHCTYRNCVYSRELLRHYQKCVDKSCPICGPVRSYVANDQGTASFVPPSF